MCDMLHRAHALVHNHAVSRASAVTYGIANDVQERSPTWLVDMISLNVCKSSMHAHGTSRARLVGRKPFWLLGDKLWGAMMGRDEPKTNFGILFGCPQDTVLGKDHSMEG
jgi:hypothetical protein